ncbi:TetR/AcrR family transcriptional regulator [Pseudomaricurvus alkylphenolicus]|jgi:AcrR family transcriptional regulator|uniref:TetR/AcrR family transcriptional regulator n=1 Tax=Pseudomaricurvus alkylphenolicus TaxID=1306991 RepID=UPI001423282B|nr:TetR/AcrR family transcriptional regulator [Pseudomaricurvus alkylphenolicus]NIB42648.1 TetR/AcrR family transcriptional regulator [Pseudomaricurvus alkylphenolicus]
MSTPKPSNNTADRRNALILKAQELFARKGIDAVSLNEINKAAGQKNTSAMHYHFGSKQGLLDAVIYEHYGPIDNDINSRLDQFDALPVEQQTARLITEAVLLPFVEQLETPQGVDYLVIVGQVFLKSSDMILKGHPDAIDKARQRAFERMNRFTGELPEQVLEARQVMYGNLMMQSLAIYARAVLDGNEHPFGGKDLFISNLTDTLVAALTAPLSEETKSKSLTP